MVLGLALRNLLRNTRRTALSMVAVVAGVAVLILGQGFIGGLEENIIRAQVDALSAHVLVRDADYPTEGLTHPVDELVEVTPELAGWLDAQGVTWTTRLLFAPRAVHGADSLRVRAIAYEPDRDPTVFPRDHWSVDGKIPTTAEDGVLLSQGVARILGVTKGDRIILETRTSAGAINALDVPVAGIFAAGNSMLDLLGILVPMPLAEDLVRPEGRRSHVLVKLDRRDRAEGFAAELAAHTPEGATIATWVDETRDMIALQQIRRRALDILVFVLMGMSATGIANTILMAAYERIREIGTLRAMGMTRMGVVRMFVLEGAMMGLIGGLAGAAIGGGTIAYWSDKGIDLSGAMENVGSNVAMASMLYTESSATVVVLATLFGVGIAVAASIWPALVASKMPPAEAVRAE